jgi:membrane-associated phospholipid phosphatase
MSEMNPQDYAHFLHAVMAAGLISAIGFSRLYLGVHYPTDILAGYAVGLLWLMLCVFALQRHSGRLNGARINPRDRTLE